MIRDASFDRARRYRYRLTRRWDERLPSVGFVLLNPSTADADRDDPTVRRCIGFARTLGFGSLEVVNLFALRATRPALLLRAADPVGPRNDAYLRRLSRWVDCVVVGWGARGSHLGRNVEVVRLLQGAGPLYCLGLTDAGHPRHPLYLPANTRLVRFRGV